MPLRIVGNARCLLAGTMLLVAGAGCARSGGTIGGPVPETPLEVVRSSPEPLSLVEPFGGSVHIEFQRTLSERPAQGAPSEAVVVSPQTGPVTVNVGGGGLSISMEGGFRARTIYRVTVLPRFADRYGNPMAEAFDLIFSTGPELEPNLLAGIATDRLNLRPVPGIRVDAIPVGGDPAQSTVTDSLGIYAFPHLPAGRYAVVAYEDQNRNREPDFGERQAFAEVGLSLGDTLIATELRILAPDTTSAVLETVAILDSLALRVVFDDYLDPDQPLSEVQAQLVREGANAPEIDEILRAPQYRARTSDPAQPSGAVPDLPDRELVLILSRPLLSETTYVLEMGGVWNINGVPGGGGSIEFEGPPEPPPPPSPLDDPQPGGDPADPLPG